VIERFKTFVWLACMAVALAVAHAQSLTPSEPIRPTWDQLMSGSLEGKYLEVSGMVGRLQNRDDGWTVVTLHTARGDLKTILRRSGLQGGPLEESVRALVRVRGHLMVDRDPVTQRIITGQIRMQDAQILVDRLPPTDMFATPLQSAASLTRANPDYDLFRWVKVSGQIVHVRSRMFFLMDKGNGLRFITDDFLDLQPGDLVEVVGYQDGLNAAAPVLRGAVARKTGTAPLPTARKLSQAELVQPGFDSQWIKLDVVLTDVKQNEKDHVLEVRAGDLRFWSRLDVKKGPLPSLRLGSQLELTGTYCAQGEYKVMGPDVAALDLLLNSPSGIRVLSAPSWWTLERLLGAMGILVCLLVATIVWVTQLHRKVEQRTAELAMQIQERQRVEHLREMEQERARIAQDLHDELGSDITTVGMLVERVRFNTTSEEQRTRYIDQLGETARTMVGTLDEIVWAMNPRHDSLTSLVGYLGNFAERFLALANITLNLEVPTKLPERTVASRVRHQLFLVFKEALANVVRHAAATRVTIRVAFEGDRLRCVIEDNGQGLTSGGRDEGMSGLTNMKERLEKLGGRFEIGSAAGAGTTLRFELPLQ
jgi:signal transduction histidine kinase